MVKIAPSTEPIKTLDELISYCKEIENHAYFLHVDIRDDIFVKGKTFGHEMVKELNNHTLMMLDVHLMEVNPDVKAYVEAGANMITIHFEAFTEKALIKKLKEIRKLGALAGLSIKPDTPICNISNLLKYCDLILVMSVFPGKSGQQFIEETYTRLEQLKNEILAQNLRVQISVDGGINEKNAPKLIAMGANILVSGSYVYNSKDRVSAIKSLL